MGKPARGAWRRPRFRALVLRWSDPRLITGGRWKFAWSKDGTAKSFREEIINTIPEEGRGGLGGGGAIVSTGVSGER